MGPKNNKPALRGHARREPFQVHAMRFVRRLAIVCTALVLTTAGFFTVQFVHHFLFKSNFFKVAEVKVLAETEALERSARMELGLIFKADGDNLLDLDAKMLAARMTKLPRARRAQVRKVLPGTLEISFEERRPVVIAQVDRPYAMDADGVLLADLDGPDIVQLGLPVLTGIRGSLWRLGDKVEQKHLEAILAAVEFVDQHDPTLKGRIVEWNMNSHNEITAILASHTEVRFGDRAPLDSLDKLSAALATRDDLNSAGYIDLRMERQIVYHPDHL